MIFRKFLRSQQRAIAILVVAFPVLVFADSATTVTDVEIAHLFSYLESSGCSFNRNGSWYDAHKASDHLRKKYDYWRNKGKIESAESFIVLAATQSSVSGEKYRVRCSGKEPVASADWFGIELSAFRRK